MLASLQQLLLAVAALLNEAEASAVKAGERNHAILCS